MADTTPDQPSAAAGSPENRLLAMMLGVAGTELIGLAAQLGIADLLKRVLVVLEDEKARLLLRNCRDAMAPGECLLIAEPDPSTLYGRLYDVFMMMVHGTRLRWPGGINYHHPQSAAREVASGRRPGQGQRMKHCS